MSLSFIKFGPFVLEKIKMLKFYVRRAVNAFSTVEPHAIPETKTTGTILTYRRKGISINVEFLVIFEYISTTALRNNTKKHLFIIIYDKKYKFLSTSTCI